MFRSIMGKEGVWTRGANDGRGGHEQTGVDVQGSMEQTACSCIGQKNIREYWYSTAGIEY